MENLLNHDIGNINFIRPYAEELGYNPEKMDYTINKLKEFKESINQDDYGYQEIELKETVKEANKMAQWRNKHNIKMKIPRKKYSMPVHSIILTDAVYNLFDNSLKYGNENNKIDTGLFDLNDYYNISITDQSGGCKDIDKIGTGYSSSDKQDKVKHGTGSTESRYLIQRLGGYIEFSNIDKGVKSDIYLPKDIKKDI